jgi:hypothetical protein
MTWQSAWSSKAPLVEEMQDSLQQTRKETAAALRQQEQVGYVCSINNTLSGLCSVFGSVAVFVVLYGWLVN